MFKRIIVFTFLQLFAIGSFANDSLSIYLDSLIANRSIAPYKALVIAEKAENLITEETDSFIVSEVLYHKGRAYYVQGMFHPAIKLYEEALEISHAIGDSLKYGNCNLNIGSCYWSIDNAAKAFEFYREALRVYELIGDLEGVGLIYNNFGNIYSDEKKYFKARSVFFKAVEVNEKIDCIPCMDSPYINLGILYHNMGMIDSAIYFCEKAVEIKTKHKPWDKMGLGLVLNNYGDYIQELGDTKKALELQNQALELQKELIQSMFKDSFLFYQPKDIVSGDFYWAFENDEIKAWVVSDCTGHGVPGALMSMLGNDLLNEIVIGEGVDNPSEVLSTLNKKLIRRLKQNTESSLSKDGMEMGICVFNKKERTLLYSGANMNLLTFSNGKVEKVKGVKRPIGYFYDVDIPYETVGVPFNDPWFMTTSDGYRDQFGGDKDKKIMQKRLNDIIIHNESSEGDLIYNELKSQFNEWKGNKEQVDDVCVWGVKLKVD